MLPALLLQLGDVLQVGLAQPHGGGVAHVAEGLVHVVVLQLLVGFLLLMDDPVTLFHLVSALGQLGLGVQQSLLRYLQ